jgi:hypothetical protein
MSDKLAQTIRSAANSLDARPDELLYFSVKAWGVTNYRGELMASAFFSQNDAEIESLKRWPIPTRGESRAVPVIITRSEKENQTQ